MKFFFFFFLFQPIPIGSKKKNKQQTTEETGANKNENGKEASCEDTVNEHTELTYFIDGFPIRTTVTTRRPTGRIRCVGV